MQNTLDAKTEFLVTCPKDKRFLLRNPVRGHKPKVPTDIELIGYTVSTAKNELPSFQQTCM